MKLPDHLTKYQLTPQMFEQAMTHRSFLNESNSAVSNERLEFLGDAILEYIISDMIYQKYPQEPEGILTAMRSRLVQTQSLSQIAQELNLGLYLQLARGEELAGGRQNPSLLENAFEALIGAVYLSGGIQPAIALVQDSLGHLLNQIELDNLKDPKSLLQEQVQAQGWQTPIYKVHSEEGPDHAKRFTLGVYIDQKLLGEGSGKSKQQAQQAAASIALTHIESQLNPTKS